MGLNGMYLLDGIIGVLMLDCYYSSEICEDDDTTSMPREPLCDLGKSG